MLNLRCTQKLLQRLKAEPAQDKENSTTKLGDWYANLLYTKPEQLILFMSEKTLLPVLVPAKPIDTLLPRFRAALREVLTSLKVPEETILHEESAMVQVRFKKTINRSVLGTMNDFARMPESYTENKKFSLLELSLMLADAPCGAIKMESPDRATRQLFGCETPQKTPGENLIYLDIGASKKRDTQASYWLGGRFTAPVYIEEIGAHPEMILWVEQESGRILSFELLPPKAPVNAIALTLNSTLSKHKGLAPSHIKVETEEQAALLRRAFVRSMAIEVGPLPELGPIKASLFSRFGETEDEPPSYLLPQTTPEAMGRLFRAASRLYQAAPWKYMSDGVSPSLSAPSLGLSGAAFSVMGKAKQSFGFMLFSSAQDAMLFRDFAEQAQGKPESTPGVEWIALEFVAGAEVPPPMRKEIAQHRWEVAGPKAYPEIRWLDKELKSKPYTDKELALLTAAAEGLAIFATKNKASLSKEELFTARGKGKSQELPGNPEIDIIWPHPQLSPPTSAIESGELPSEVGEVIKAFLLSQPKDKEWQLLCEGMIEELYRFSLFYMGVALHGFRASILEEFLLSFLPRKVSLPKESHAKVPRVLLAFFSWLEKQEKLHPYLSRSIQKKIEEIAEESAEAIQSEGNFGLAKSIAALATKSGVDFSNPKEVEKFMKACNAGQVDGFSDLLSSLFSEPSRSATPKSKDVKQTAAKKPTTSKKMSAPLLAGPLPTKTAPALQAKAEQALYTLEVFIISGPISKSFAKKNRVIARTIEVLGSQTLEELHFAIFGAFDREEQHLFAFEFNGKGPGDPEAERYSLPPRIKEKDPTDTDGDATTTTLSSLGLTKGSAFGYQFDFGDDWWHQVNVIQIGTALPQVKYPRVTAKEGTSPPQYADEETDDKPKKTPRKKASTSHKKTKKS